MPNFTAPPAELHKSIKKNAIVIQDLTNVTQQEFLFEITNVFEMGQMAITFFNQYGLVLFYFCMCLYLYGDLAIYAAAVATTIRDVACTFSHNVTDSNMTTAASMKTVLGDSDPCWNGIDISRINAYRIFLTGFATLSCPFVFFNLTKTKFIQFTTLTMRWLAFGIMFALMGISLARGGRQTSIPLANFQMCPNLLGVCIYSFMCHHSLPSLVTSFNKKSKIYLLFAINFIIVLVFYLTLSFLSTFTFSNIQSLITLNFQPSHQSNSAPITNVAFFQYYLSLFPVFAISASFPIIGITLRNNLKNLFTYSTGRTPTSWFMEHMFFPLLALIPPLAVVLVTNNISFLVGFTGSYAGTFIQYVIPITLVMCARRQLKTNLKDFQENINVNNNVKEDQLRQLYQSPFKHSAWSILILIWSGISLIFVTVNHILSRIF